jgi:anaerobic magnesium-protoporphyrin IX monomethyl ester cyclase
VNILLIDVSPFGESVTPVSLGHVGAALAERGHAVEILSIGVRSTFSPARLRRYLEERRPRLVGFGTYQRNLRHVVGLARLIKETLPGVSIVLGGPQATFMPDDGLAALPHVDFVCRGEGESVAVGIVEAIEAEDEGAVPGTTRRSREGQILTGPPAEAAGDLDRYPSPWLSGMLDPSATSESIVLTSRGCPHDCVFCYTPAAFARKIRCNSVDRVLDEISYIAARGTGRFWFADPNFSFSEDRVTAILEGILRRGLKVEMWIETRADLLNPAVLRLMKRAGVYLVALGLESASPNVFPNLGKRLRPEEVREAVRLAFDAAIDVELFSQYALPNERREDALATLQFVQDCGVKIRGNSNAQQMQLYFGSRICSEYERHGVIPLRESFPPYLSIGAEFATRWMSREDIEQVKNAWKAASLDGGKRVVS